ncbi:subtilisin family serine protease [Kribbella amoyensis]|uniref:Subtilisin family serine protease n=1 Tax=Kribbella amoyensis TaxID=996641 RepID=A0A561BSZ6_9ACTN|nr:S8 family serine peptidase [Kribbella amoyensis]TWD82010.1 subtilisin family serine protease [Kribbella amoyensis]
MRIPTSRPIRRVLAGVLLPVAVVASALAGTAAAEASPLGKIEPGLSSKLTTARTDFWVRFEAQPTLGSAARIKGWKARGEAVVAGLRGKADRDQADAVDVLRKAKTGYTSLYIDNSIYVRNGSRELAEKLAADPKVVSLRPTTTYQLPAPTAGSRTKAAAGIEWGVSAIHADQAWTRYRSTGQGIVIGSIDSGAQYDHPALVSSYRGTVGDGTFSHDYNWYDPENACGSPVPCDNVGHGSHTLGTMAGDDHAGNQIGVAPGARWISAKGCATTDGCSDLGLALSAQWMLAPTKLDGSDPDPSKRPNIVNNSWSAPVNDPWYQDWVRQWTAAGIFTTFAAGNNGPACSTNGSPGDYAESYAVGAVDEQGKIASFSSRGNPQSGEVKPDIVAPGQMVRSSVPGGRYAWYSGTSMAAPHLSGAVALLWSAAPSLVGDVAATRALLDRTAHDRDDTSCGGTAADNSVYGEGMLDVLDAIGNAPRPDAGLLTGKVTDATGSPVAGAKLSAPGSVVATSDAQGNYQLYLDAGEHDVTVQLFGYDSQVLGKLAIQAQSTTTKDITLAVSPRSTLSGLVRDGSGHGWPLYAKLTIDGVPGQWFTKPTTGRYSIDLPVGAVHRLTVQPIAAGYTASSFDIELTEDTLKDVNVPVDPRNCKALGYDAQCGRVSGGLVHGVVTDTNTKQPITAATVTANGHTATTIATPDDEGQPDGLYWLFVPLGSTEKVSASRNGYQVQRKAVEVERDWITSANFALKAGRLTVSESAVDARLRLGKTATRQVTLRNDGTAPLTYSLAEAQGGFDLQRLTTPTGAPVRRTPVTPQAGRVVSASTSSTAEPSASWWMPVADYPTTVKDHAVATSGGLVYSVGGAVFGGSATPASYVYDPAQLQWRRLADMPEARQKPAAGFVDGKLYVVSGWGPQGPPAARTMIYDPAANRWTTGADNPKPWGAAGSAVLDGKVYSVGGCEGECQTATTDVTAYDVAHNRFDLVAPYPEPVSWPSCGGIDGKLYCAGGLGEGSPRSSNRSYVYDPVSNAWSRIADLPVDLWASSYAVANGQLVVAGGVAVRSSVLTNETFGYDPESDRWTALPNSSRAIYRGAAACGFYRVGGLVDARAVPYSEQLPGFDDCEEAGTDAPWLSESATTGTLAPKTSVTITVTLNAKVVAQPGVYRSRLLVRENTPYAAGPVDVTMTADAPPNWARLSGTVTAKACDGSVQPVRDAVLAIDRRSDSWTLTSGADGGYALWLPGNAVKTRVVVAANGYRPASVDVVLRPGADTLLPFTLQPLSC